MQAKHFNKLRLTTIAMNREVWTKSLHQVCQHLLGMAFLIMLHQGHYQREILNFDYIPEMTLDHPEFS